MCDAQLICFTLFKTLKKMKHNWTVASESDLL